MKAILAPLKKSHNLRQLIDELENFWQEEQNRRLDFYNWVDPSMKAEFIDGEIVIHSPVVKKHNQITKNLVRILDYHIIAKNLGFLGVEKIMCRFSRNDYGPDLCFFIEEKAKEFREDQTIFPVPDFVIEVLSHSTESRDRGVKFEDYQDHGVTEYWIIDPDSEIIEQYINQKNKFLLAAKHSEGEIISVVLKGFAIPVSAVFNTDANHDFVKSMLQ